MPASQYHDTHEIVIAATLWLMHRYQQSGELTACEWQPGQAFVAAA